MFELNVEQMLYCGAESYAAKTEETVEEFDMLKFLGFVDDDTVDFI